MRRRAQWPFAGVALALRQHAGILLGATILVPALLLALNSTVPSYRVRAEVAFLGLPSQLKAALPPPAFGLKAPQVMARTARQLPPSLGHPSPQDLDARLDVLQRGEEPDSATLVASGDSPLHARQTMEAWLNAVKQVRNRRISDAQEKLQRGVKRTVNAAPPGEPREEATERAVADLSALGFLGRDPLDLRVVSIDTETGFRGAVTLWTALGGLLLGVGLALLAARRDGRARTLSAVERATGLPVLGALESGEDPGRLASQVDLGTGEPQSIGLIGVGVERERLEQLGAAWRGAEGRRVDVEVLEAPDSPGGYREARVLVTELGRGRLDELRESARRAEEAGARADGVVALGPAT